MTINTRRQTRGRYHGAENVPDGIQVGSARAGLGARLSNSGSAASTVRYETPGPRGETLLAARADCEFGTVAKRDVLLGAAGGHLEMD